MIIEIQYVKMDTSESTDAFITEKLEKLADKYDWLIRAVVYFKLENDPKGNGKICEIELSAPGPRIFAKSNAEHFEKAAMMTLGDLEKQINKRKEILKRH
tara:strand:- start:1368 stop:1667 length:300 start_codon:yes stop_codon:yes gene_type:complete